MKIILIILSVWNLITFLMMGIDKWKAKRGAWRIPERVLLICAFMLGSVGAVAFRVVSHFPEKGGEAVWEISGSCF